VENSVTKTLIIIRHAKSDWSTGAADFERPLLARGGRDAYAVGSVLAPYDIDLVWCSAAVRARQTWEEACAGGALAHRVEYRESLYGTSPDLIALGMRTLDESVSTLALVNHEPTVSGLVGMLAQPSILASEVAYHFPTAGVAILTMSGPWQTLQAHDMTLVSFQKVRAKTG